jgi:hypothetical protein
MSWSQLLTPDLQPQAWQGAATVTAARSVRPLVLRLPVARSVWQPELLCCVESNGSYWTPSDVEALEG